MGTINVAKLVGKKAKANYFYHLIRDLEALERMVVEGLIEKGPIRIGAEQEFFIVDHEFLPNNNALTLLEAINDPHFTTEIGDYNLEINLDPLILKNGCFEQLHSDLLGFLEKGQKVADTSYSKFILSGILPTIDQSHIGIDHMMPVPRYKVINEAAKESRAQDFNIHIKGVDDLNFLSDSVMPESCNTSWQMHLQIDPDEFIEMFNWAQAISGPVLAACSNSPLLFGRELWHETRIALFTQTVDIRTNSFLLDESQSRVSFEDDWQKGSISDIFKGNISRFRSLVTSEFDRDSMDMLDKGEIPRLLALNLHNGTVYRWNRACYGIGGGKPHLRIENRYIPSGPSPIDQVANFAFWVGLMKGKDEKYLDIASQMDFRDVRSNFYKAARYGMGTQFTWEGRQVPGHQLLLEEFLPMSANGLRKVGISESSITRFLGIIEHRVKGHNGSSWIIDSYRNLLKSKKKNEALQVLTANLFLLQQKDLPVSEWPILQPDSKSHFNLERKVRHIMNTNIISVEKNDPVELVVNMMRWNNIHHIPVIKGNRDLIGLLSWSDIEIFFESEEPIKLIVKDIMKREVITITSQQSLDQAKEIMSKYGINCLPVVNGKKLIGILTSNDF